MRPLLAATALLLLCAPAYAQKADAERKELEEDICYHRNVLNQMAYEHHQRGDALRKRGEWESRAEAMDYDTDYKIESGCLGQLCKRYKEKYGERPPGGCCGVETALTRELEAVQKAALEEAARIAKLAPADRGEPCGAFKQRWKWMPSACDKVSLPPPVVRYTPN